MYIRKGPIIKNLWHIKLLNKLDCGFANYILFSSQSQFAVSCIDNKNLMELNITGLVGLVVPPLQLVRLRCTCE